MQDQKHSFLHLDAFGFYIPGPDPRYLSGAAIVNLKFQPGCVIPWHWHTPNERVIVISGSAKAEMRGMDPVMLKQGDFILFSAKQIHQFTAVTAADIYVMNDSAFDIHYVDASGREIPPQAAIAPK
jgi:hypothetical protein